MHPHPLLGHFSTWLGSLPGPWASKEIFWTVGLIACAFLAARIQFKRIVSRSESSMEDRRQSRANFRNGLILSTLAMLGFVWGGEIQSMILSLAAIAAAMLIVSKELVSCFYGSLVFSLSKPARIGDAIEIGDRKGELLDHNWLSLTLLEISDTHYYSGRVVKIPSSLLLTSPLVNLSHGGAYRFGTLSFLVRHEHATAGAAIAEAAAAEVCAEWIDDARSSLDAMRSARMAQMPDADPHVSLASADKDSLSVSLRFVAPSSRRAEAQSQISKLFFERYEQHLKTERIANESYSPSSYKTHSTLSHD